MNIQKGDKPSQPKKESNQSNPILCDMPEKEKEGFQVIAEDKDDSILLDGI